MGREQENMTMTRASCDGDVPQKQKGGAGWRNVTARDGWQARLGARLARSSHSGLRRGGLRAIVDLFEYLRAKATFGNGIEEFDSLFKRFIAASVGRRCLRLRFDADDEADLGVQWLRVSLDQVEESLKEGGPVSIEVEEDYCDAVFVTGLERVSRPASLIAECRRKLKRGGQIWVQTPLSGPYLRSSERSQTEYWRFTPEGLQILLQDFDEILCSLYLPRGSALRSWSYYYGIKPAQEDTDYTECRIELDKEVCECGLCRGAIPELAQ
jgi:hypothetical protein